MLNPSGLKTFHTALGIIALHAVCATLARADNGIPAVLPVAGQPAVAQTPAKPTTPKRSTAGKAHHRRHARAPAKGSPPADHPTALNLKNLQIPADAMKAAPSQPTFSQHNAFDALVQAGQTQALHWAAGGDLPLPGIDDPALGPKYKDSGFHFGLNYRLNPQWNVSGLAGVKTSGGPVASPDKPTMDQLGIQAQFKF